MNIDVQHSQDRGMTKTNWLNSRHSFSFGNYMNPARMGFGLLRVLNDDTIEAGSGFPTHHHDNMEIVTIVLEGELRHKDSTGGEGVIKAGEVQRMSAGRGIYHSEFNPAQKRLHLLQIWIETASEVEPGYEQAAAKLKRNELTEIVGSNSMRIYQDASLHLGKLGRNIEVEHNVKPDHGSYVFMINGSIEISKHIIKEGDAAGITDARTFKIKSLDNSEILVIDVPMD